MDYANSIETAVQRFYSAGENDTHAWLLQIQSSVEAWDFVWYLLDSSKSWEVQFFAANTLYTKISKQWEEVPTTEYIALQNRLISAMKQSNSPKLILSRLCQSLAAFFANNNVLEQKESSKCLIDELIEIFPCNDPSTLYLLLQTLLAFPSEFEKRKSMTRMIHRDTFTSCLRKVVWILLQVFTTCNGLMCDKRSDELYIIGLECTLSWFKTIQVSFDITGQIYPHLLQACSRYISIKQNEEDSKGFDVAQECLTGIITNFELFRMPQIFWSWAKSLVCLAEEHGGKHYYELLTTMGEAHSRTIVLALADDSKEEEIWISKKLIDLILQCSNEEGRYPTDEKYSAIPFGFWYTLQDDVTMIDAPLESQAKKALKPVYAQLTQILLRKATLPATSSEGGGPDDRELLRCYRQDAADTYIYCYNVLEEDMLVLLGQRLSKPSEDPQDWISVESSIFAFKSLSESLGTQERYYVPAIMDLILSQIQYDNYPKEVLACACSTIGAFSEWIGENAEPWLEKSMQVIAKGLTNCPITSPPASMALKDIARECSQQLAPMAPSILDTISRTLPTISTISGKREGYRLMYTAGKLINSLSSTEQQLSYLESTLGFCIMNLRELLQQLTVASRSGVENQLKMITMFLSTLKGPIGKPVFDVLLPLFNQIISHPDWSIDDSTLEAMHGCALESLFSLSNPKEDAKPLLQILRVSYKTRPHPAALNLLYNFVLIFGRDSYNVVAPVFVEMSSLTLAGVAACQNSGGNLSDLSYLLEAYFKLLAQICKKNMSVLLENHDQIPQMLQCGITCLSLPENEPRKAAGNFLTHAIMEKLHLQTFIQPIGQELTYVILQCIDGKIPRNNLNTHAEVLFALSVSCRSWIFQWLHNALFDASGPTTTSEQKEAFLRLVTREHNKWRMYETVKEFSLQCRQKFLGL